MIVPASRGSQAGHRVLGVGYATSAILPGTPQRGLDGSTTRITTAPATILATDLPVRSRAVVACLLTIAVTGNAALVPTLILLGSFLVPVTFVAWAFQTWRD